MAKQYIYIAAKNQDRFFTPYLEFLKNKLKIDEKKIPDLLFDWALSVWVYKRDLSNCGCCYLVFSY